MNIKGAKASFPVSMGIVIVLLYVSRLQNVGDPFGYLFYAIYDITLCMFVCMYVCVCMSVPASAVCAGVRACCVGVCVCVRGGDRVVDRTVGACHW